MLHRPRFVFGVLLTGVAGFVDAVGFISLGGFYVSFMSGNTTQLGIGLVRNDWSIVGVPSLLVACFVIGAFTGTLIASLCGRWSLPATLLLEGVLLGCALILSLGATATIGTALPLALAMGAQNAALKDERGRRFGATFVTGTVFGFGETLALWCIGRAEAATWSKNALGWLAMAAGAAAGSWAFSLHGLTALVVPAFSVLGLALVTGLTPQRTESAADS
ncbi:MAG: YoaK family protein [Beijerinckiaceae bacterium]